MKKNLSRRILLQRSVVSGIGLSLIDPLSAPAIIKKSEIKLGK